MTNARTMSWIASVMVLAVVAHLILDIRGTGVSRMNKRASIAPTADVASAVSVRREGAPAIVISKASGEWRLVSPVHAAVDRSVILELLDSLAFTPIIDSMDESELRKIDRRPQDFGLQPPLLEVETLGSKGIEKIFFGNPTPAGDGVYASVGGENIVFVVQTNVFASVDKSVDGFRSRKLFDMDADEIGAFDIRRSAGSFARFIRNAEKWRVKEPNNATASASRVRKFLATVFDARVEAFVWPVGASNETEVASASLLAGYGLDPDSSVTLTLKGMDGVDRQVSFGNEAENGSVYALAHNGGAIVTVDSSLKDTVIACQEGLVDTRLFPVEESSVTSVSIVDGDTQCTLAKEADGGWRIDSPISAPADSVAVADLVGRLLSLNVSDADPSGVRVTLAEDVEPALVPRGIVYAGSGVESFRSRKMADITPLQVRRLVATKEGAKSSAVVYDADRRLWHVESSDDGGVADEESIETLLSALNPLEAIDVVKLRVAASEFGRYGLDTPAYMIAIDMKQDDSVRRNIRIGDKVGDGRYATIGSSDAVFVLSDKTVKTLTAPIVH